jgi:hypothetical protein
MDDLQGSNYQILIIERLARMETKIDTVTDQTKTLDHRLTSLEKTPITDPNDVRDHEIRIRALEKTRAMAIGVSITVSTVLGAFGGALLSHFGG